MKNRELSKIFKALGNERRLLIVTLLLKNKELTVSEISRFIRLSFKATSKHLLILNNARLVSIRQVNLHRFYSLNNPGFIKQFLQV